jgi:hypothetical protein
MFLSSFTSVDFPTLRTCLPRTFSPLNNPGSYASFSNSVRYFGANATTFLINSACCSSSSFGGGVVRVATGTPTSMKNLSFPAGEQIQSKRTGLDEALWNWWGAFAGMFSVLPAHTTDLSPRKVASISPSSRMNVSSKSCRCGVDHPRAGCAYRLRRNGRRYRLRSR